eukprot:3523656-Rhodomonas_salina.1
MSHRLSPRTQRTEELKRKKVLQEMKAQADAERTEVSREAGILNLMKNAREKQRLEQVVSPETASSKTSATAVTRRCRYRLLKTEA